MTTYYVRKTGSDSNAGTSPAAAWLTIDHAIAGVSASGGDTIYVGAGTYRELVGGTSGASWGGNVSVRSSLIADTDGSHTGDAGEVIITAFLTNDTTAPSAFPTIRNNNQVMWTLQGFTVVGGTGASAPQNCSCLFGNNIPQPILRDMTFWAMWDQNSGATVAVAFDNFNPSVSTTNGTILIERCRFFGAWNGFLYGVLSGSSGADVDYGSIIRNCLFFVGHDAITYEGANTITKVRPGGLTIKNCLIFAPNNVIVAFAGGNYWSTTYPVALYNSVTFFGNLEAAHSGEVIEDYNVLAPASYLSVSAGTHTKSNATYAMTLQFGQEQTYGAVLRPFGMPVASSPLLGFGSFDSSVTDDLLKGIRPGSGIGSVSRSVGPFERANSGTRNTSVIHTAPQSLNINGPGYQDFEQGVQATTPTTISIWMRFDATYAGTLPQMKILNGGEAGVADASVTATGSANTWAQYSLTFTPTSTGIITVRFQSNDTNGAGQSYFADYTGP